MYVLQICAKVRQFSSYFITDYYRTLIGFKRTKNNFLQYNTYVNTQVFFFLFCGRFLHVAICTTTARVSRMFPPHFVESPAKQEVKDQKKKK